MTDRIEVCKFYICSGECEKKRDANHYGYCQKCNNKKRKLNKIREREASLDY